MALAETFTEKRGIRGVFQRRLERRLSEANILETSNTVAGLKLELAIKHPDAEITVTNPKGHPFTRISVQAIWGVESDWQTMYTDKCTDQRNQQIVPVWQGKMVEITLPKKISMLEGVLVNSRLGEKVISRDSGQVTPIIRAAIDNPLPFISYHQPGSETYRRPIK